MRERAARCAFRQALGLFFRGDLAPAMGWVARGGRLLEGSGRECVEQVWLQMLTASGQEMWDWVLYGNPIPGMVIVDLGLTVEQQARLRQILDGMLRERAGREGRVPLTNRVNIGIGTN